jgi:phosphoglycerate dehydrogenase-like enzyme
VDAAAERLDWTGTADDLDPLLRRADVVVVSTPLTPSTERLAIDVWYDYPADGNSAAPSRFPFTALPNVLMTPHSSGLTRQTLAGRAADIAANIARLVVGGPLRNVVAVAR